VRSHTRCSREIVVASTAVGVPSRSCDQRLVGVTRIPGAVTLTGGQARRLAMVRRHRYGTFPRLRTSATGWTGARRGRGLEHACVRSDARQDDAKLGIPPRDPHGGLDPAPPTVSVCTWSQSSCRWWPMNGTQAPWPGFVRLGPRRCSRYFRQLGIYLGSRLRVWPDATVAG